MSKKLIGPISQIVTLRGIDLRGAVSDDRLEIITDGGILVEGETIVEVGNFEQLRQANLGCKIDHVEQKSVALPGFVDAHTHICFAGNRAMDYALRSSGKSYLEIAQSGGGIWSTVQKTRAASIDELKDLTLARAARHLQDGVTTIEVKSGYGLSVEEELKMLRAIKAANEFSAADLIPSCLAAHMKPRDFEGSALEYLNHIVNNLLPIVKQEKLAKRVDIFVEKTAFSIDEAKAFLSAAQKLGFEITVHADQFSAGGSSLAVEFSALSADHLEVSSDIEIAMLAKSNTVALALPGSSYGLGIYHMTPARKLLDAGAILAIASDWNPGSAPMGDLLVQASFFGIYEKLSAAEVFSALTFRAAKALNLENRGRIEKNMLADMQLYPGDDYRQILYYQGKMKPHTVYKNAKSL